MMAKWKKISCFICALACILACAAFLLPEKRTDVITEKAHIRNMVIEVNATGILQREVHQLVLPPFTGIVREVYVKEGDAVRAGDPLFRLDCSQLEAQYSSLLAQQQLLSQVIEQIDEYPVFSYQMALLQEQIAASIVRAPTEAQVLSVGVQENTAVQGGVMLGSGNYCAVAYVTDSDADRIKTGQKATVTRGNLSYTGKVTAIKASNAKEGLFEVTVSPLAWKDSMPIGLQAEVSIVVNQYTRVCVPIEALLYNEDAVFCVVEGVAVKCPVTLGDQDAYYIAVEGVPDGICVILNPEAIEEGDKVNARDKTEE